MRMLKVILTVFQVQAQGIGYPSSHFLLSSSTRRILRWIAGGRYCSDEGNRRQARLGKKG
jgi:hypothetical protein